MPLYDYICACGAAKEVFHKLSTKTIKCHCGKKMKKQLSPSLIKFNCPMPTPGRSNESNTTT
jgi:putative FmdB family regulatory protein